MDIQSLYYFSELAKDLHITRTASRLFLSQQTLSNHIQRLEEHYGVQLLHRKPVLSLTAAGETVLAFARLVVQEEDDLKRRLSDLEQEVSGSIRFGASQLRMQACIPSVLPVFSALFPRVELRLTNANSAALGPMVLDGQLDLAVLLCHGDEIASTLEQVRLMEDPLYLCMTDKLLTQYCGNVGALKKKAVRGADVRDFFELPFCISSNQLGSVLRNCFAEAGFPPKVFLSDSDLSASICACFQGLAACVLTKTCLAVHAAEIPPDLNCFPLNYRGSHVIQSLYLVSRKDRYRPRYTEHFRTLLIEAFQNLQNKEIDSYVQESLARCPSDF